MTDLKQKSAQFIALAKAATEGPWDNDGGTEVRSLASPHFQGHKTYHAAYEDKRVRVQPFLVCRTPQPGCYTPTEDRKISVNNATFIAAAHEMAQHIAALQAENDRLRVDAERYLALVLWLQENNLLASEEWQFEPGEKTRFAWVMKRPHMVWSVPIAHGDTEGAAIDDATNREREK